MRQGASHRKARQDGRSYHQETGETGERREGNLGAVDGIRAEGRARHFAAVLRGLAGHDLETRAAGLFLALFGTLLTFCFYKALTMRASKLITSNV